MLIEHVERYEADANALWQPWHSNRGLLLGLCNLGHSRHSVASLRTLDTLRIWNCTNIVSAQ